MKCFAYNKLKLFEKEENVRSVLVTGGARYIGSHTCVELLDAIYDVVIVDKLCNSCRDSWNWKMNNQEGYTE